MKKKKIIEKKEKDWNREKKTSFIASTKEAWLNIEAREIDQIIYFKF